MSDMTIVDKKYIDSLESELLYTQNQLELAQNEIYRLNERLFKYEENDQAEQGGE